MDLVDRQDAIRIVDSIDTWQAGWRGYAIESLKALPSVQPERKKDIIQKFHDYQIDWLKSHYDIELEPQLEEMIARFLHDTANSYMMEYMMEIDREEGEQNEHNKM